MPARNRKSRETIAPEDVGANSSFEPTDLVAAIVLFLAIPAITFVALDFVGYPVGGPTKSSVDLLAQKEEKAKRNPPITREEVKEKLDRINQVIDERANEYLNRHRHSDPDPRKNVEKQRWYKYGESSLSWAESHLDTLLGSVETQPDLAEFVPRIKGRLHEVKSRLADLRKENLIVE